MLLQSNSQDDCKLDNALNVLARGLEENKCSCDLWKNYLRLYSRHKESTDLVELCATALQYTQHYDIWWQVSYINFMLPCYLLNMVNIWWQIGCNRSHVTTLYLLPDLAIYLCKKNLKKLYFLAVRYTEYS